MSLAGPLAPTVTSIISSPLAQLITEFFKSMRLLFAYEEKVFSVLDSPSVFAWIALCYPLATQFLLKVHRASVDFVVDFFSSSNRLAGNNFLRIGNHL